MDIVKNINSISSCADYFYMNHQREAFCRVLFKLMFFNRNYLCFGMYVAAGNSYIRRLQILGMNNLAPE